MPRKTRDVKIADGKLFQFLLPHKIKKQIQLICLERGIEMASYVRESIKKNNENYKYLIRKVK